MKKQIHAHLFLSLVALFMGALECLAGDWVNDVHSKANRTLVSEVVKLQTVKEVQAAILRSKSEGKPISITGGRHAMGGQQFGTGSILLDMSSMKQVLSFDQKNGLITVEAGIQWPELINYIINEQRGQSPQWGIRQKQTGADRLSIGGALSANVHGRGLTMKPFIDNVESFTLVNASGDAILCSRSQNAQLFRLTIGGYGLFGVITSATLRLSPRTQVERVVEVIRLEDLVTKVKNRIKGGFLYGDFQYSIDPKDPDFLMHGVFSCYKPVAVEHPHLESQRALSSKDWDKLYYLAHTDKKRAFEAYSKYYLSTSGQIYWSDLHQMSTYNDNYHEALDKRLGASEKGNEMITEIYVPRQSLVSFMKRVQATFRTNHVDVIYGTIRFIEKDNESFLAWARKPYACIIFNLHFVHSPAGFDRVAGDLRDLIDAAIVYKGSYYLTYHRYATRSQVEACYPQFEEFLHLKLKYDPQERFQSDWYRHYKKMFGSDHADR